MILRMILYFSSDVMSIILSMISLAWAVVANRKACTVLKQFNKLDTKSQTKYDKVVDLMQSTLFMFLWRLCTVGSRVIVFALALRVGLQGFSNSVLHGIVITISAILLVLAPGIISSCVLSNRYGIGYGYIIIGKTHAANRLMKVFFNCLDFNHVSSSDFVKVHGRNQAILYYFVTFIITGVVVVTWYIMIPIKHDSVVTVFLLPIASVLFILGIMFMVLHYSCCHHNRKTIRTRTPCHKLLFCEENDNKIDDRSRSKRFEDPPDDVKALYSVIGVFLVAFLMLTVAVVVRIFFPYRA